ncbi:SCO family protein [Pseudomonas sp. BN417]|uniref:SCO family protein n=1 Tax=Pseudomonas sp. BN417 TaxID=2567890 RepID=UPI002457563D|nr:SCO family protein [Pseudomonas sp. BN417]MDH4558315.1 SCO family protein [Pseudomonas sp. BN417]
MHLYQDLLKGKAVAVNLIFTFSPDSCPLSTANLARVQELLGDQAGRDIHFYSMIIDSEHETLEVLKAYLHLGDEDVAALIRHLETRGATPRERATFQLSFDMSQGVLRSATANFSTPAF